MSKYFRWKAILPLTVVLVLVVVGGLLFLDPAVRRGVEFAGTKAVGAKVDLRSADVRVLDGTVRFGGLAVTDPAKPMTNLFEAEELVFDVGIEPALEKKVVIDTMAVRGLRFGTARATSGAIPRPQEPADDDPSAIRQAVDEWRSQVQVPPIALSTLTQSVNVAAISAESLATVRAANVAVAFADTARTQLLADLQALDPKPMIDSAEALATRLRGASLRTLGLAGVRTAVSDTRRTLRDLEQMKVRLAAFEDDVKGDAKGLRQRLDAIPAARAQDYVYARSLLQLPSFEIPTIGPQLFSSLYADKVGEVMYWVRMAEKYVPPGLKRQTRPGPRRVRASGTTVLFPKETTYPTFLTRLAELSLAIGGAGAAAGEYEARAVGVTSQPAVYGAPTRFLVSRVAGVAGPRDVRISGSLDHRTDVPRDSVTARMAGVPLPALPLAGLGATVALNEGVSELDLVRVGDSLTGRWSWTSTRVAWTRDTLAQPRATTPAMRLVEDGLWNALSRLNTVELEARVSGTLRSPRLAIHTNLASAIAGALRAQLGEEVRRAEQQVRARVDALADAKVAEARAKADEVRADLQQRLDAEKARLEAQKAALEAKLRELVRIPGIGGS
jgi:uncharacterized protein (TIGR03545 family)